MEDRINYHSRVLDMLLQPFTIRPDTLEFLFGDGGYYRYGDKERSQISPKLLPENLFVRGSGTEVFAMVRSAIATPYAPRLSSTCWWILSQGIIFDATLINTITTVCEALLREATYATIRRIGGLGISERHGSSAGKFVLHWEIQWLQPPNLRNLEKALFSEKMPHLVLELWARLEQIFPRADHRGTHKCPSLLTLAAGIHRRVSSRELMNLALAFPSKVAIAVERRTRVTVINPDEFDATDACRTELFNRAIAYVDNSYSYKEYNSTLYETVIANDYDLCPRNSEHAKKLYRRGYRHGALYFLEVHLIASSILCALLSLIFYALGLLNSLKLMVLLMESFLYFKDRIELDLDGIGWVRWILFLILCICLVLLNIQWMAMYLSQFGNFVGELIIARPYVRYKHGMFLAPLLRGEIEYDGFTKQEYSDALTRFGDELRSRVVTYGDVRTTLAINGMIWNRFSKYVCSSKR
jgi:hypothetical protein